MPVNFDISFQPLIPERWDDFEKVFGPRGATGGCWCMWWRLRRSEYEASKGEGNRRLMQSFVTSGEVPGLIAYVDGVPVAWVSIAPREQFPALDRSPILKQVDDQPVWSVVCFFISRAFRRRGLGEALLRAALVYARAKGARIVEGYPVEPKEGKMADLFAFTGLYSTFRKVGFAEVARRSATRPIMRYTFDSDR